MRHTTKGSLIPKAARFREQERRSKVRISRTVVNQAITGKEALLSADATADARFERSESIADLRVRSMMCAPLIDSAGNALGVIQIDSLDPRSRFQQEDLDLLTSVATQAALAIERANLHEQLLKRQGTQQSQELASDIQRGFFPKERPVLTGYEFFHHRQVSDSVGGDFLAYVPLDADRLVLALGDVAGRGVPAALIMARLYPTVRYQLLSQPSLPLAMAAINRDAVEASEEQHFVTLLLAEINARTNMLTVVNAGHLAPLIRRASGHIESVGEGLAGLPAGIDAEASFQPLSLPMHKNDRLFLFTDGLAEVPSAEGGVYGLDRLRQFIADSSTGLPETVGGLVDDAHAFAGGTLQDDFCLVACRRAGSN
jgi:serine phosphatase RsbU (regulator of sigma subunit)